jgi:hypothetical protein
MASSQDFPTHKHYLVMRAIIPPSSLYALRQKFGCSSNAILQMKIENLLGDKLLADEIKVVLSPIIDHTQKKAN